MAGNDPFSTQMPDLYGDTTGTDQIPSGTKLESRTINLREGETLPLTEQEYAQTVTPGSVVEIKGKTPSTSAGVAPSAEAAIARFGYTGTKLVDRNGTIARNQYDPSKEAYGFLAQMDSGERVAFLGKLQSRGLLGKGDVTARFTSSNINATEEFLMYANHRGVTGDVALPLFLADPNIPQVSTGGRIRTTPKEDLRAVFRETTRKYLGRDVTPAEIEKFVKSYTAREVSEARGGGAAPSAATAAEVMVQQQFGDEAAAVGALDLFNILDTSIKGLA